MMRNMKLLVVIGVFMTVFASAVPTVAYAKECSGPTTIFPHWYDGLQCNDDGTVKSPNEQGSTVKGEQSTAGTRGRLGNFLTIIAMNIVRMLLYVVGYVSLGFIIWGGIKYIISQGDSGGITSAKKTILNAVIGLILSIFSVAIVTFVAGSISK